MPSSVAHGATPTRRRGKSGNRPCCRPTSSAPARPRRPRVPFATTCRGAAGSTPSGASAFAGPLPARLCIHVRDFSEPHRTSLHWSLATVRGASLKACRPRPAGQIAYSTRRSGSPCCRATAMARPAARLGHRANWNHSCQTTCVRSGPIAVHRITPGPRRILPVCMTLTWYGRSIASICMMSVSTAGPNRRHRLPRCCRPPPSPLVILTVVKRYPFALTLPRQSAP